MKMKTFLGSLLIGGTALGAGMLALPLATASGGLIPSWAAYFLSWLFSVATGLLFVEIGLWLPRNANIVSMATALLGNWGKWLAWALYIFLFYSLTVAYVAGGGRLFSETYPVFGILLFTSVFGLVVFLGTKIAGRVNGILMAGLILSYLGFVVFGVEKIDFSRIQEWGWKGAILGLPVIFTSFSYQGTVPSLLEYLGRDAKKTRFAIIAGTTIPLIAYIIWDIIIKGIVPIEGPHGLLAARELGVTAVEPLKFILQNSKIALIGNFFAFFALTTSFIGVTLGLLDFLADSLKIEQTQLKRGGLALLVYVPPVIIALTNPSIFFHALGYAGGFGCAILLGFLPTLMVWVGRYHKRLPHNNQILPGGKLSLCLLFLFAFFEIGVQIYKQFI
jgi:tyrosine-specific transport protein